jgi:hypothetical protein
MAIFAEIAGQNWLITPAARAVNESPPASIKDQKWLITLTGVALANLQAPENGDLLRNTIQISPDIRAPIRFAINQFSIPVPTDSPYVVDGSPEIFPFFQLVQWAPFASLGSIFDKDQAVNAQFAVDLWRPSPFLTLTAQGFPSIGNIFQGIRVDVAVRGTGAILYRVNYHITLLGKIGFAKSVVF